MYLDKCLEIIFLWYNYNIISFVPHNYKHSPPRGDFYCNKKRALNALIPVRNIYFTLLIKSLNKVSMVSSLILRPSIYIS